MRTPLAVVVSALAIGAPVLRAQTEQSTYAGAYGSYSSDAELEYPCGPQLVHRGPGSAGAACTAAGVSYDYFASAAGGLAQSRAVVSGGAFHPGNQVDWQTDASARWSDRLTITGGSASSVRFTVAWDGTQRMSKSYNPAANSVANSSASTGLVWGFTGRAAGASRDVSYSYDQVSSVSDDGGPENDERSAVVHDVRTFVVPLGAAAAVDFQYFVDAGSAAYCMALCVDPFSASASADFGGGGRLVGVGFADAAGNDVTGGVRYAFENGTRLFPAPVPEPSTWALLATGGLVMAGAARVRGRGRGARSS